MGFDIGVIFAVVFFAAVFAAAYWFGWRNGEVYSAVRRKKFHQHLSGLLVPGNDPTGTTGIIYLIIYPLVGCITKGVDASRVLLEYIWVIPMLAGVFSGIFFENKTSDRGRLWLIWMPGFLIGLITVGLGYPWLASLRSSAAVPPAAPWVIGGCGVALSYFVGRNAIFGIRYARNWAHNFRIIPLESVPHDAGKGHLRQQLYALTADCEVLAAAPLHKPSHLTSAQLANEQTKCHALVVDQALFLRFVEGINDEVWKAIVETKGAASEDLKLKAVWVMIDWQNVELVKVDKMIGYAESRVKLKNSGVELTIYAVPKALLRWTAPAEGELKVT